MVVVKGQLIKPPFIIIASKSIYKIKIKSENGYLLGLGFFLKISDSLKCLITTNNIINESIIKNNIYLSIELNDKINIELKLSGRFLKFFDNPIGITVVEIKDFDCNLLKDTVFLDYDLNYTKGDYSEYLKKEVCSFGFDESGELNYSRGHIHSIDKQEFSHTINMSYYKQSNGSQITLYNDDYNIEKVIGIYIKGNENQNIGYFIGEIIEEIKKPIITINNHINIDNNLETINTFSNNQTNINFIGDNHNKNLIINNKKIKDSFTNNINNHINNLNFNNNNNHFISINGISNNNKILNNSNMLKKSIKSYPNLNSMKNKFNLNPIINKSTINLNSQISIISLNNNSINISNISSGKRKIEKSLILTNDFKKAITLHFQSSDQTFNYFVRCNNDERFNMVVNKIVENEPNLIKFGFVFLCNGNKIHEYKTIKDNQLKNGDVIILQLLD